MLIPSIFRLISHSIQSQSARMFALQISTVSAAEKLYAHLQKNQSNVERALTLVKIKLDSVFVNEVLRACHPSQLRLGLRFFVWAGTQSNYRHSPFMYTKACDVFKIKRNPEIIEDVIEAYRADGYFVSVKTMKVILNLCKQAKLANKALWVLRKMPEFYIRADTISYNLVIRLFVEKGDIGMADKLMKEMSLIDLYPDMITYVSMIKGFCDVGKLEDACGLLKAMKNHGCVPNAVTYSTLLDGFCRFGDMEEALELLREMEKESRDCSPNTITYTSIIQALCQKKMIKEALGILDRMEACECFPNRVTASTLIQQLCEDDRVNEVHKLIARLTKWGGLSLNECYSSLVISLVKIKRFDEAEKVLREMLAGRIRPDGLACGLVLKEICSKGKFLECFCLYEEFEKTNGSSAIGSEIFSVLLLGLCQQGYSAEAGKLAKLMVAKRIRLKASYVDKIAEHLKRSGDEELMLHLARIVG